MSRPSDTSPEAERVLREVYRNMPFAARWHQMGAIYRTARILHAAGVRDRHPGITQEAILRDWARLHLRDRPLAWTERETPMDAQENLEVLQQVVGALTQLSIPYALSGSWASSLQGKMRFTHDADVTVEPFPGQEEALCNLFGDDYYVSLSAVREAVQKRSSFNIIHFSSGFKVDVFVRKDRPFEQSVMARRREWALPGEGALSLSLVSPEDSIILKLEWFRIGGEASEQQWRDVLGVLEVQQGRLDDAYLDRWAEHLGVADLLARARQESQPG